MNKIHDEVKAHRVETKQGFEDTRQDIKDAEGSIIKDIKDAEGNIIEGLKNLKMRAGESSASEETRRFQARQAELDRQDARKRSKETKAQAEERIRLHEEHAEKEKQQAIEIERLKRNGDAFKAKVEQDKLQAELDKVKDDLRRVSEAPAPTAAASTYRPWPAMTKAGTQCKKCKNFERGTFCHLHAYM